MGGSSTGFNPALGRQLRGEGAAGSGNALWEGHQWKTACDFETGLPRRPKKSGEKLVESEGR